MKCVCTHVCVHNACVPVVVVENGTKKGGADQR